MNRHSRSLGLALAALLVASTANAGQEVARIPFYSSPPGTAALGGGLRLSQSFYRAFDNDDQRQFDLIPLYLYNGRYVFARGTSGGLHIVNNDRFEVNVLAQFRFQQLNPDRNQFYAGMSKRRQTLDAGFEFAFKGGWGELRGSWVGDTLDRHAGHEAQLTYRYLFDRGPWQVSPFVSYGWQDENLTNYYFGVRPEEALPDRPAYEPGRSNSINYGLNTAWWATDDAYFFANLGFFGVDDNVAESPLVEENSAATVFLGGTYIFGNARRPDGRLSAERRGEWSWRVNYGYQADGNIVSEIDQGDFSRSKVADTNIAGVTLGKLLSDGRRINVVGKLALFRHLEEDEGNGNFNSYAAYLMAVGRGFGQWSGDEWFRWGFGFGMSYADEVPIAEQRKQAASGSNTSRFLNYLEMTLDFPLRRVFKNSKSLRNCYAGLTVVHRSGIFGTSDLLGDVAGGSDWITAHFECTAGVARSI